MSEVPKVVKDVYDVLCNDQVFLTRLETSIRNIMKDGKIDQLDIPEFIFIITDAYNQMTQFELTYDELPILIKLLYNFMIQRFNLIPEDKRADFERLVDSALRLVMMQPKIKKATSNFLQMIFPCCFKVQEEDVIKSVAKPETKTTELAEVKKPEVSIEVSGVDIKV